METEDHVTTLGANGTPCVLVTARSRTLADALSYAFEKAGHPALAASPDDALDVVDDEQVSTLVVDADGDREAVIEFVTAAREQLSDLDVVLLVRQRGPGTDELVELTGARGSITRDINPQRFVNAVVSGRPVPELRLVGGTTTLADSNPLAGLTDRQREVLSELLAGGSDAQIAGRLGVSAYTVRTHMQNVFLKLGVNTRFEAAAIALQAGLRPSRNGKQ